MGSQDNGRPLPKFGEWDVNDPSSAEGFTVIFSKARDEKKANAGANPGRSQKRGGGGGGDYGSSTSQKPVNRWLCCIFP